MSEAIRGLPPAPAPSKPRDAAAVVMIRGAGPAREVFWLKRGAQLSFAGGYYAFPGGQLDLQDGSVPIEGAIGEAAMLKVAAARELFEETGVLVAEGASRLSAARLAELRKALLDKRQTFAEQLKGEGLRLRSRDFADAGRWITPPFLPKRFDARFFLVEAPSGAKVDPWPGEIAEGAWVKPAAALRRWEEGTALLHPPNLHALQTLARLESPKEIAFALSNPPYSPGNIPNRMEFQKGIRMYPLITPTLPPAAHTNSYLLGNGELLIVDPGAAEVRQYAKLLALIAGHTSEGMRPKAVVLTHHHVDHIGGAVAVRDRLRIPIWAHERTAERLSFPVDRLLKDGEVISLVGSPVMRFKVLLTPGHAKGHICLVDEATRAAVVGDMVAGLGTIVIDPPEGDMTDYLQQLVRLRDLPVSTLYPSHGPAIPDGPAKLDEYLKHREQRERKVFEAISPQGSLMKDIVARGYADVPVEIHPLAERSTQAILIKLVREQKVVRKDDRYFPG